MNVEFSDVIVQVGYFCKYIVTSVTHNTILTIEIGSKMAKVFYRNEVEEKFIKVGRFDFIHNVEEEDTIFLEEDKWD